jgi:hypothetical protein
MITMEANETIVNGNIAISLLDGWKFHEDGSYSKGSRLIWAEDLKYHSDWKWIMPFVTVIESKGWTVKIEGETCSISHPKYDVKFEVNPHEEAPFENKDEAKLAAVWICASTWAEWYFQMLLNKNKGHEALNK